MERSILLSELPAVITAQTPVIRKTASAQGATLDELVVLAAGGASDGLADMARRMVAALLDMTAAECDAQAAGQRIRSGNLLQENSYACVHLLSTGIELALRKEMARLAPAPSTLSLVPLEEMDSQLAFAGISRPFDIQHAEALASLGTRLGLLLGRGPVRAIHNPFRPEVFLRALQEAWHAFEPDEAAHASIVPLLRTGVVFDFLPIFEALNDKLKPARTREERFVKTDDSAAARAAAAGVPARRPGLRAPRRPRRRGQRLRARPRPWPRCWNSRAVRRPVRTRCSASRA